MGVLANEKKLVEAAGLKYAHFPTKKEVFSKMLSLKCSTEYFVFAGGSASRGNRADSENFGGMQLFVLAHNPH